MKILLCGYMGSGKTTIGQILAKENNMMFYDLDDEITTAEGDTVKNIFHSKGEIFFRKKERELLYRFLQNEKSFIMSLGGGTPCYGDNLELIKGSSESKLIYLKLSAEEITERLFKEKDDRPLIAHLKNREELLEFVRKHLFERNYYYNQADIVINADSQYPEEIARRISEKLHQFY